MKKIIIALAFVAFTIGNAAMAGIGGKEIDKRIRQAFEKEFVGAADVKWYTYDGYIKVDFTFKDMPLMGFYSTDGELMGIARNIHFTSLPLMLQLDEKKNHGNYWITEIYELANKEGTRYYLTLENADRVIKLRSDGTSSWEYIRKEVKK